MIALAAAGYGGGRAAELAFVVPIVTVPGAAGYDVPCGIAVAVGMAEYAIVAGG